MSDNREGKSVLTLKNVTKRFSGLVAVNDLSLDMKERTIHALIGPVSYTHLTLPTTSRV